MMMCLKERESCSQVVPTWEHTLKIQKAANAEEAATAMPALMDATEAPIDVTSLAHARCARRWDTHKDPSATCANKTTPLVLP